MSPDALVQFLTTFDYQKPIPCFWKGIEIKILKQLPILGKSSFASKFNLSVYHTLCFSFTLAWMILIPPII